MKYFVARICQNKKKAGKAKITVKSGKKKFTVTVTVTK